MVVRIYGETLNVWTYTDDNGREYTRQLEKAYKEYDSETNELVGVGSEDFSLDRWHKEAEERWVWTWDGVKRNKGGHRWFECVGYCTFRKSHKKGLKELMMTRHPEAALVQLR